MSENSGRYFYLPATLDRGAPFVDSRLDSLSERHKVALSPPLLPPVADPLAAMRRAGAAGLVIEMSRGWPGRGQMRLAAQALQEHKRVFFYWPREQAVECIDEERLQSAWRHWLVINACRQSRRVSRFARRKTAALLRPVVRAIYGQEPRFEPDPTSTSAADPESMCRQQLKQLGLRAQPVAFPNRNLPGPGTPFAGTGAYLRLDFWARISSGGSYGHTCYVAKALAESTRHFIALMAHRYDLLDELGVHQVVLAEAAKDGNEINLLRANEHYHAILKPVFEALRPDYLYERICLGNYVGARLSLELGIPCIVEYNGSEISMKRSFDGGSGYEYEDLYLQAEEFAFRQATLISVVSEPIRDELIARGIDPGKILVNPNGADPEAYAPPADEQRVALRRELGFGATGRVIGFSGTFGGWHGVDILAQAIPLICKRCPEARFLLIGDGHFKHLVDEAVVKSSLEDKVVMVGRVPQQEGARLLGACDIFVSPHSSHMVDSRFFGSPTKLFEYMAMGAGIVASALEQIGQVLSPALRVADAAAGATTVTDQRAVLCKPGDVDEFVEAVAHLVRHREVCEALGRNARQAVLAEYSWTRHVEKVWHALLNGPLVVCPEPSVDPQRINTGDAYKDEVQNQWNNDACGSHYVKQAERHTLDWYLEAEAYRYGEYAPWMPEVMEFARHSGKKVLEIGGGLGTDLAQFARHGAVVTDLDLSGGHLALARENFRLRGLEGTFVHHDAEKLPFDDDTFDVVYSNGVIHHTPNTAQVVAEIHRVLKPGGRAIIMVYAENSLHYWRNLVRDIGIRRQLLDEFSMGEIMSGSVEISENNARPLVKVYTARRLEKLFAGFTNQEICKRQLMRAELPALWRWLPLSLAGKCAGWNLIIKAEKQARP